MRDSRRRRRSGWITWWRASPGSMATTRSGSRRADGSSTRFTNISAAEGDRHMSRTPHGARPAESMAPAAAPARFSLGDIVVYFLRLGTFGFGGPIALVGYMQRDLVETRGWFDLKDYKEGLALAQLAPGPLAAQLAIYLGWLHHGVLGATLVAVAFVLPSFVMVLALSAAYVAF